VQQDPSAYVERGVSNIQTDSRVSRHTDVGGDHQQGAWRRQEVLVKPGGDQEDGWSLEI
jgi:hypothetical protein